MHTLTTEVELTTGWIIRFEAESDSAQELLALEKTILAKENEIKYQVLYGLVGTSVPIGNASDAIISTDIVWDDIPLDFTPFVPV